MWGDGVEGAHPKRHNAACDAVVAGVRGGRGDLELNWFAVRVDFFSGVSVGVGCVVIWFNANEIVLERSSKQIKHQASPLSESALGCYKPIVSLRVPSQHKPNSSSNH
jgi:hypothetical protein